ncbi:hypothetical protein ARSEF4850_003547 [Beauveria asiatica]
MVIKELNDEVKQELRPLAGASAEQVQSARNVFETSPSPKKPSAAQVRTFQIQAERAGGRDKQRGSCTVTSTAAGRAHVG